MPNWNTNVVAVIGRKEKIIDFLNVGLKNDKKAIIPQNSKIDTMLLPDLTLRSWYPMPKTYNDWDTTNPKLSFRSYITWNRQKDAMRLYNVPMTKEGKRQLHSIIEDMPDELLKDFEEDYKKYSEGYDKAVEYQKKTYGVVGWYDYNYATLGTKWDATIETSVIKDTDKQAALSLFFQTAWCYPSVWLKNITKDFPDLDIYCYTSEESMEYCGYFNAKNEDWIAYAEGDSIDEEAISNQFNVFLKGIIGEEEESD